MRFFVCAVLLLAPVVLASIVGQASYRQYVGAVQKSISRVEIECSNDNPGPFIYTVPRQGYPEPYTITVECLAPEEVYQSEPDQYVPLAAFGRAATTADIMDPDQISQQNYRVVGTLIDAAIQAANGGPAPPAPRHSASARAAQGGHPRHAGLRKRTVPRAHYLHEKTLPLILRHLDKVELATAHAFNRTCDTQDLLNSIHNPGFDIEDALNEVFGEVDRLRVSNVRMLRTQHRRMQEALETKRFVSRTLLQTAEPPFVNVTELIDNDPYSKTNQSVTRAVAEEVVTKDPYSYSRKQLKLSDCGGGTVCVGDFRYNRLRGTSYAFQTLSSIGTAIMMAKMLKFSAASGFLGAATILSTGFEIAKDVMEQHEEALFRQKVFDAFETIRLALNQVRDFQDQQIKFNQNTNDRFDRVYSILRLSSENVNLLRLNTEDLRKDVNALNSTIVAFANDYMLRFTNLTRDINSAFTASNDQVQALARIVNETAAAVERLGRFMMMQTNTIDDVNSRMTRLKTDVDFKRILTADFWQMVDAFDSAQGRGLPFTTDLGRRPMNWTEMQALRDKESAEVMATMYIQGSTPGSPPQAVEREIQLICDPVYIANNSMRSFTTSSLLALVGPRGCLNTVANTPWSCKCAIRWATTSVARNYNGNTAVFPWDWDATTGQFSWQLRNHPYYATAVPPGPQPTKVYEYTFGDNMDDFLNYFVKAFICSPSVATLVPAWVGPTHGTQNASNLLRFVNPDGDFRLDSRMNFSDFGSTSVFCSTNLGQIESLPDTLPKQRLPALIILNQLLLSLQWTIRSGAAREVRIFGQSGQVYEQCAHASQIPTNFTVYQACRQSAVWVASTAPGNPGGEVNRARKVPILAMRRKYQRSRVIVRIDDGSGNTFVSNDDRYGVSQLTIAGNVTVYTNPFSQLDARSLLGETMMFPGTEEVYKSRTYYDYDEFPTLVYTNPRVVYDPPRSLIKDGNSAASRAGGVNYISQKFGDYSRSGRVLTEATEMNMTEFYELYGPTFVPDSAIEDLSYYARVFDWGPAQRCGAHLRRDSLDLEFFTNGTEDVVNFEDDGSFNNEHCNIRNRFILTPMFPKTSTTEVSFQYREWKYRPVIEFPEGEISELLASSCPTNTSVLYTPGSFTATVVALTPLTVPQTLLMSVCTAPPNATCIRNAQVSLSRNDPLQVTVADVNVTYYFQLQALFDGGVACYTENGGLGLNISITDAYRSSGSAAALETINYRTDSALASAVDISNQINYLLFLQMQNQYNTEVNLAQANAQFQNATAALLAKVQAITANSNDFTGLQQVLDAMVTQINNNSAIGAIRNAQIIANTQNITTLLGELQNLTTEGKAIVGIQILIQRALNSTLIDLDTQLEELRGYLSEGGIDLGIDINNPVGSVIGGIVKGVTALYKLAKGNCSSPFDIACKLNLGGIGKIFFYVILFVIVGSVVFLMYHFCGGKMPKKHVEDVRKMIREEMGQPLLPVQPAQPVPQPQPPTPVPYYTGPVPAAIYAAPAPAVTSERAPLVQRSTTPAAQPSGFWNM